MGIKLSELENGTPVILQIKNNENKMELNAVIARNLKNNIAVLGLDYPSEKRLNFGNVLVDMQYMHEGTMSIVWKNVKIVTYKSEYIMQVSSDGERMNRRNCFRVGVHATATMRQTGHGAQSVMIRDVSLSGFAITDRGKTLGLQKGMELTVMLEDAGFHLTLVGKVVRIEEREDLNIYGLEICNLCKDLSKYISVKQRPKRK